MDSNDTNIDFIPEIGSPAQLRPAIWSDDMSMRSKTVKVDQGEGGASHFQFFTY